MICQAVNEAAAWVSTAVSGKPALGGALAVDLHELGRHRVVGEGRMVLEDGHRQRPVGLGRLQHRRRARARDRSGAAAHSRSSSSRRAAGCPPGRWRRSRRSPGLASFTRLAIGPKSRLPKSHSRNSTSLRPRFLTTSRAPSAHELHRRELAGHHRHGLGRRRRRGQRDRTAVSGTVFAGFGADRPGRELHGRTWPAIGMPQRVVHQHLVVALRHAHGRQDGAGGVGPHQQVDLVGRRRAARTACGPGRAWTGRPSPPTRPAGRAGRRAC